MNGKLKDKHIINNVQDFIEKYYPDYHRSQAIVDEQDLFMALNGEHSHAVDTLLRTYSKIELDAGKLKVDWMEARIAQLETAIQGYANSNGPECIKQVEFIATYQTWEDKCREEFDKDNKGMSWEEYLLEAQTDLDYLTNQDETLEGVIQSSREIVRQFNNTKKNHNDEH